MGWFGGLAVGLKKINRRQKARGRKEKPAKNLLFAGFKLIFSTRLCLQRSY
jgi:hypothetical protein